MIITRSLYKLKADGRHKARFIVHGWKQKSGIHYGASLKQVCRISSLKIIPAIVVKMNLHVKTANVVVAYIYASIDYDP